MMKNENANPNWWTAQHASAWDRVKEAFARDWDQTKHDFSKSRGRELDQDVGDTVKQAAGKEDVPPRDMPNMKPSKEAKRDEKEPKKAASDLPADTQLADVPSDYRDIEPALRYGYGAALQHTQYNDWDTHLESRLRDDWTNLDHGRSWEEVKEHVRMGWNRARSAS
jgi:hypothetical protein